MVPPTPSNSNQEATDMKDTKLYLWNWVGGGYNSCRARNRDEAIKKAQTMCSLVPALGTLRECTSEELRAEDRAWGPYD